MLGSETTTFENEAITTESMLKLPLAVEKIREKNT